MLRDERISVYLPIFILMIIQEFLFTNDSILKLTGKKVFLTAFRLKSCLSLILVPRLWLGDQSIVLKS
jgi:hypothetical protein